MSFPRTSPAAERAARRALHGPPGVLRTLLTAALAALAAVLLVQRP
ncbi:hypothetical protein [Kitasatospora cineracea]|uniref:Uncharacterized protein n=1 Tax=Kitasatospora cineracea TaxID=88074 RepID=A0A3N4RS96_9ACTN|nr:hypothetical protein [Kitasatospora cineracea]ROR43618.1 hypothetical protein EDD39_1784 [Kitasatospora cineracea]RPE33969.1 hypothetical protein EDD38_2276 [Kitasatospora cineracea]